jgi:hypothetical protein
MKNNNFDKKNKILQNLNSKIIKCKILQHFLNICCKFKKCANEILKIIKFVSNSFFET